jgi:hypothetical protein
MARPFPAAQRLGEALLLHANGHQGFRSDFQVASRARNF